MADTGTGESELFIHLDTDGLAALLRAVEAAMVEGRGRLTLGRGDGLVARSGGSSDSFAGVTVTFADSAGPPDDNWRTRSPEPEPEPLAPVFALEG